jgi:hypothetical protein
LSSCGPVFHIRNDAQSSARSTLCTAALNAIILEHIVNRPANGPPRYEANALKKLNEPADCPGPNRRRSGPHPERKPASNSNALCFIWEGSHSRADSQTVRTMLPSALSTTSASATLSLSRLNIPLRMIAVYASRPPSPTTTQHSPQGGTLLPYPDRTFTGWTAPASPGALIT